MFIDIWTRIHDSSLRDTDKEIQRRYQKSGEDAARNFSDAVERGLQSRSKRIRNAANQVLNTGDALAARQRDLAKATDTHTASAQRLDRTQEGLARQQREVAENTRLLAQAHRDVSSAQQDRLVIESGLQRINQDIARQNREHVKNAKELRDATNELTRIRLYDTDKGRGDRILRQQKAILELRRRDAAETRNLRDASLDLNRVKEVAAEASAREQKFQSDVNRLLALGTQRTKELTKAENDLAAAKRDVAKAADEVARRERQARGATRATNLARRSFMDAEEGERGGRRGGGGRFGGFERGLGGIFTSIPFVPGGKAGAFIGTGLITGLGGIAEAVTTASQALWLLPAAAAAAGAGFATLKIGLSGFDKALKDMGDAKKFAKDLQGLAPNAQQAALEIQHLVGGLDGLKNAVQQSLFAGVAPRLHQLGNAFMPQIRNMFTGVSGAFNGMFGAAIGQLTSSGSVGSINSVINNIVKAFQNLTPAIAPVIDAFTKLTQVGSTFLPGLGSSIADLAKHFDDFITRAQQTGQLQHWIRQGLDAAKELGRWIGDLGRQFYNVFGGKSPQQFHQTLQAITGTLTAIGRGMLILSNTVNTLVQDLNPVARMLGGWPNLIRDVIAVWALWKVGGLISDLMKVGTLLGITLPAAAESGAGRISAALAAIKMPAWIATFLALWNLHGDAPGTSASTANDKQIAGNKYFKDKGKMPDGYQQWLQGSGPMPKDLAPYYKPGAKPGDGDTSKWPSGAWGNKPWSDPGNKWWGNAWSPYDVPAVPGKGGKGIGKDKAAIPFDSAYTAPPRPGESAEEYSTEGEVLNARHRLEQDRATLAALEKDNNATAEEIQAQKNKIATDTRESNEAELRLTQVQQEQVKKRLKGLKDADDEFSNIDQDFGLSKGLPGLVKNLVGMIGDIAAAPLMGQLKAVAAATGTDKNTFGAFGIMAQANIAAGKSPLLGIPAGQPGGPAVAANGAQYGTLGAGPWDRGYGPGTSGVSTMPSIGPMAGAGPASIAPGVGTAGYAVGGTGASLVGAYRPMGTPPGGPGAQGAGGLNWDALAAKESSGNWGTNTGNGYFGGLQFDQSTWNAYKPPGAPSNPAQATRDQQIQAGQTAIAARGGPQSLWPQNYDQLYHTPHRPWSAQYDSYQPMGSWIGSGGGIASAGYSSGADISAPSGGFPGFGASMPAGAGATYTQALMKQLGLQPLAINPAGGGNPTLPAWLQDFVHTYGGPSLTAGSSPHGSLHGVAGGSDYATDVTGSSADMDRLAKYLYDNPELSAQMIHQGADGFDYGVAGGQRVPYGSYYTTPGGTYGDEGPMVHWAPAIPSGGPGSPLQAQLSGWSNPLAPVPFGGPEPGTGGDGSSSTGGGGWGTFSKGVPGSQGPIPGTTGTDMPGGVPHAQLTGFGTPDPDPSGFSNDGPTSPLGPPRNASGWQPAGGGGGNGIGGLPEAALVTAAGMFPGGGAAAQTAMQLINRTIGYGQQAAAIGVQGLMDTFKISSPDGDDGGKSDLSQGWFGRVAAGFAGARPAGPSGAGAAPKAKKDSDPTKDPSGKQGLGQDSGGDTHNVYGGMNIPGSNNTININPQQSGQSNMSQTDTGLGAQASAPASTSFGGFF